MINYFLSFACGAFTKITDNLIDDRYFIKKWIKLFFAIAYGSIAGYLTSFSEPFATIILAITIGVLLKGKIDDKIHQTAIAFMFLTIAILGFKQPNLLILSIIVVASWMDEWINEFIETKEEKKGFFEKILSKRITADSAALVVSLATGEWTYFLAIASFDLAYHFLDFLMPKILNKRELHSRLILDLMECQNKKALNSVSFVRNLLKKLPEVIGMTRISEPLVFYYKGKNPDASGVSGIVAIAESHIALHTYPSFNSVNVDIVSCKKWKMKKGINFLKKSFEAKELSEKKV